MLKNLWFDDCGFIISLELLLLATILVFGLMAAWMGIRNAMLAQLQEIENSILLLNPVIEQAIPIVSNSIVVPPTNDIVSLVP